MSYYLCLDCFEVYRSEFLGDCIGICPKANCDGELIDIDEAMIEPIIILNQKGYWTMYCCSGHSYENNINGYIKFYKDCIPNSLPDGWTKEIDDCIRYKSSKKLKTDLEKRKFINKRIESLIKWAENLPNKEEELMEHISYTEEITKKEI